MSWIDQGRQEHGWFGHGRAPEALLLAQARLPGRATDASTPTPSGARYIAANPEQWVGADPVGDGECVALVKAAAAGIPSTKDWKPGRLVKGDASIPRGAIIATFDSNGKYTGHAAIYLGQDGRGIWVLDQWNYRDNTGVVIGQKKPDIRPLEFGRPRSTWINLGESYRVVN